MDLALGAIQGYFNSAARSVGAELSSPWLYLQLGLVLTAAGVALAVNGLIRSRIDVAALGKDWRPALQRFVRELMGSASVAVFAILMALARTSMEALFGPHGSYLLSVASNLAFAWLIIRLASSGIRNAFVVRVVSLVAFVVAALSILGRLEPVLGALDSVSVTLGGLRFSPLLLIELGLLLIVALWLTDIVSNFIESRITRSSDLTPSVQVLLVKIIRLALMVLAIAAALSAVGINLSALAIFSGAAGVGIGFGLQKIIANFISGLILLADKSVKPGDLVTIGDSSGRISAMTTRYITVAAGDGREFLVPNEDLITQKVTNWTYTDRHALAKVGFATSYDADPRLVCRLASEIAANTPKALTSRPPGCLLSELADTGMKFSLTFWVSDPGDMDSARSEVMLALWEAFRREGIHVPYPAREIRVTGALAGTMPKPSG